MVERFCFPISPAHVKSCCLTALRFCHSRGRRWNKGLEFGLMMYDAATICGAEPSGSFFFCAGLSFVIVIDLCLLLSLFSLGAGGSR